MTTLYRFFAADGRLLYVGIAGAATQRWEQHAKEKGWWGSVARVAVENYPTRAAAAAAERNAIRDESPVYNVVHNKPTPSRKTRPARRTKIVWLCDVCGKPIDDKAGYIQQVRSYGDDWLALHRHCDPFPDDTGYWIAVERYRTADEAEAWFHHLKGKVWWNYGYFLDLETRTQRWPDDDRPLEIRPNSFTAELHRHIAQL